MDGRNQDLLLGVFAITQTNPSHLIRSSAQTQTLDFTHAQNGSQLETNITMVNPCVGGACGHGKAAGLIAAERGSLSADEHQISPKDKAAATESKEPLLGTMETKVRTLGSQGEDSGETGVNRGIKKKLNA
ncbi:hypothetical protein NDU88_004320 [Pleurodeles waltl]|uniref:Uncharacterized protein n=1 Tax=Pleurodeles waltl TaxID=8319 RepID=A0AAV7VHX7_PLEWA|nr:hypothetical protein NDU88_004320 [Pleurodeles waltl]